MIVKQGVGQKILTIPPFLRYVVPRGGIRPWYLTGNISGANCKAAFNAKDAADLATSYINLATPGTNNAAPGTAPDFVLGSGWDFNSTDDYLIIGSGALITAAPLTMFCLFNLDDVTTRHALLNIAINTGGVHHSFLLDANGAVAGDPIRALTASTTTANASTSTGYSATTWQVGCAVFASAASRSAYLDGGSKVTETTSLTPAGLNATYIGANHNGTALSNFAGGLIGACAFYDIALSDAQVLALSTAMLAL